MSTKTANAAFAFVQANYDTSGEWLMGRQSASEGFLRAFVRHSGVDAFWGYAQNAEGCQAFRRFVGRHAGPSAATHCLLPMTLSEAGEIGTLYRPGPDNGYYAWLRRHFDQRAFSLCGVTHTTADHAAMDVLGGLVTAPVQPWDAVVCTSEAVKAMSERVLAGWTEYLGQRFSAPVEVPCRLPIIPLGVDCDAFEPPAGTRERLRQEFGIGTDDVAVLFVGRLSHVDKANPVPLYLALEEVAKGCGRRLHLIHAGWFPQAGLEQGFRNAAATFAPSVNSLFVDGRKDDMRTGVWAAADIFTSLSDNVQETFGLTPIEAKAAGLPVVVSDWDGYRDTVRDSVDGFAVPTTMPPPGLGREIAYYYGSGFAGYDAFTGATSQSIAVDVAATRDAFARLIDDADLCRRMGEAGRRHAREVYDWRHVVAAYQALWEDLAAVRRTAAETVPPAADRPAHPLRADPFVLFREYPTALLTPEAQLAAVPGADAGGVRRLRASEIAAPLTALMLPEAETVAIIEGLAGGAAPLSDLLAAAPPEKHVPLYLSVGWLIKMGLVSVSPGDGGAGEAPALGASETWEALSRS